MRKFDDTLRSGLSTILNIDLSEDQWLQASLVGKYGRNNAELINPGLYLNDTRLINLSLLIS